MKPTLVLRIAARLAALAMLSLAVPSALAAEARVFPTPESALEALGSAVSGGDDLALVDLFGSARIGQLIQKDRALATADRARFASAYKDYHRLREDAPERRTVVVGYDAWPFPIPLVKTAAGWHFATAEGIDEIVNRRIGRNELNAIDVLHAYVDAQRLYASKDRDGDGVLQYARRIASTPGHRDGLYWKTATADPDDASPFGPLLVDASPALKGHKPGDPYYGYNFRILNGQGAHAKGGAYGYVIHGRMLAGFAMVAYPAQYGVTGIMTFIVNQNGTVYERNLGPGSAAAGARMTTFDPGPGWKEVKP